MSNAAAATSTPRRGVFPALQTHPGADHLTQPFWDAAKQGQLVGYQCQSCGTVLLPPKPICFKCGSETFEWVELPGTGVVYSRIIVRHPLREDLAEVCPYVTGVIELDGTQGAGARMIANIIDCEADAVAIGDRVEVVFDHINEEMSVPRFRPIADSCK
ncbi:MAG: Zn-ribbon domain-containing OB-fold protein [bacterium]|nr:Zn-ribbon domain-containing OB-fold protein [bacterium]